MYNSAIKNKSSEYKSGEYKEIKDKVFYNDMSKNYLVECFKSCDCVYSEPSWQKGYQIFNERANNIPESYTQYLTNINKLVHELNVPTFITGGKNHSKYFTDYEVYPIKLKRKNHNICDAWIYVWNYDFDEEIKTTEELINKLQKEFSKCLDFSCGYGEHLLAFKNFIGCDIDKNCLAYLVDKIDGRI